MSVRCRVWLQMCLYAVVMIKYWCGNLTSFGKLSTKIVGIFPICFENFSFILMKPSFTLAKVEALSIKFYFCDCLVISYQWHLRRNSHGLGCFFYKIKSKRFPSSFHLPSLPLLHPVIQDFLSITMTVDKLPYLKFTLPVKLLSLFEHRFAFQYLLR